jgi:MHS family proline/betaine transporter-like MFS transporter
MDGATDARKRQVRSAGIASITGWAMDLYDLFIILYVASTIGPLLFPADKPTLQLAFVYASFAVTLVMRPLGSALFGVYADRKGRKRAMIIAITGAGISTALMGAVPTYAAIGIAAPLAFVVLRLVMGVFVGGVVASTHTLGTETVDPQHRGLMSGLVAGGGAGAGAVVASAVYFIVSAAFPGTAFSTVGWRVMFFTGLLTAAVSLYVYRRTDESPLWKAAEQPGADVGPVDRISPLKQLFGRRYRRVLLLNVLVTTGAAGMYYLTIGFLPTFFGKNLELSQTTAAIVLVIVNIAAIAAGAAGGWLSDHIGRRATFLWGGVPMLVLVPLLYYVMNTYDHGRPVAIALFASIMAVVVITAQAPVLIFLNEQFPTEIRATGTGLSWNIGFAIGGMTPTIVTLLSPGVADIPSRLIVLSAVATLLFLVGAVIARETRHLGLGEMERVPERPQGPHEVVSG